MKEIWIFVLQAIGCISISCMLYCVGVFFVSIWFFINKKPIWKGIYNFIGKFWLGLCVGVILAGVTLSIGTYFAKSWEHINGKHINFEPRKPWLQYFKEDCGMKNPKITYVGIKNSTLYVEATENEGGLYYLDMIPLK